MLRKLRIPGTDVEVYCDVKGAPRPFITKSFRQQVFSSLHNLSHPGAKASVRLVTERFVWPGVKKDCRQMAKECEPCQRSKVTRHTSAPFQTFKPPSGRFRHVHLDLIGPLPLSSNYRYCLTVVDRATRWPEAYPLQDITAETCSSALITGWIARFGCPEHITTDRGRQFESHIFKDLVALIGATHHLTTSYHPAANGLVERLHRQLKAAIMCHTGSSWTEALPWVLLGIRSAWKEDIESSTAELVYGEPLRLPGQFLVGDSKDVVDMGNLVSRLRSHMAKLTPQPTSWHTSSSRLFYIPQDLSTATHIFLRQGPIRRSLQAPYSGPYKILSRDQKTVDIEVQGKKQKVTIDRVKPAYVAREKLNPGQTQAQSHTPMNPDSPVRKTRSGRIVKFPDYYRP